MKWALRGKRSRFEACAFHANLETELLRLQRELSSGTYQPGGYRTFRIVDPKPRLISAAPFRDRVVHHALVQVLEPHFEPRFIHHSYACRPGKGSHAALAQFVTWARTTGHVLTMDVKKYFPSIDHQVLNQLLGQRIKDPDILWLAELTIESSNAQYSTCDPHKGRLRAFGAAIRERTLQSRLRLNEGKSRLRHVTEGVAFVGFVVRPGSLRTSSVGAVCSALSGEGRAERRGRRPCRAGGRWGSEAVSRSEADHGAP